MILAIVIVLLAGVVAGAVMGAVWGIRSAPVLPETESDDDD